MYINKKLKILLQYYECQWIYCIILIINNRNNNKIYIHVLFKLDQNVKLLLQSEVIKSTAVPID